MIRVRLHDEQLETTRLRGLGFQPVCECGWKGHTTRRMREARYEMRWHSYEAHGR